VLEGLGVVTAATGASVHGNPQHSEDAEGPSSGDVDDFPSLDVSSSPFGHKMLPAFMLAPGFTNLNHGSFGTCPREVVTGQQQYAAMMEARPDQWFRSDFYTILEQVPSFTIQGPSSSLFPY
jgi:hypothetical protein